VSGIAGQLEARGERVHLVPGGADRLAILRASTGEALGRVEVRGGLAPGELLIWELCIEREHRGYGAGSEAARLLAGAAKAAGWTSLRARAHPEYGLSVYFWIRMGFRPLHGEGPEGGIWFVREFRD
jgi:ribosomal protein S18 acetylase RimI-like enzyme